MIPSAANYLPGNTDTQAFAAPPATAPAALSGSAAAALDSHMLLKGQKVVTIVHNGMPYRLQATKLGKLILTK